MVSTETREKVLTVMESLLWTVVVIMFVGGLSYWLAINSDSEMEKPIFTYTMTCAGQQYEYQSTVKIGNDKACKIIIESLVEPKDEI